MAGTVATAVLSEERLKVMPPAGAAAEIARVTFTVRVALTLIGFGLIVGVTVTETFAVSGANPTAVAFTCVEPIVTPVTCGFAAGMSNPAGTNTLEVIVATDAFALVKLMVSPPGGEANERLTGRLALWPGASTGSAPKLMRLLVTVKGAVAFV